MIGNQNQHMSQQSPEHPSVPMTSGYPSTTVALLFSVPLCAAGLIDKSPLLVAAGHVSFLLAAICFVLEYFCNQPMKDQQ